VKNAHNYDVQTHKKAIDKCYISPETGMWTQFLDSDDVTQRTRKQRIPHESEDGEANSINDCKVRKGSGVVVVGKTSLGAIHNKLQKQNICFLGVMVLNALQFQFTVLVLRLTWFKTSGA